MLHADLTLLLHTHQVPDGICFLFTAYTCCMQVLPFLLRTCVSGRTAYPYGTWDCLCYCRLVSQRDCLPTLAFHVNVYALITPPPWSIVSFFRPPLQGVRAWSPWRQPIARSPCVEIDRSLEKAHIRAAREGVPIICRSAVFAPVVARGPSSE